MTTRTIWGRMVAGAVAVMIAGTANAAEQTLQQRVESLEQKATGAVKDGANALGIEFHALVALDYLYNFNEPGSGNNQFRVFDTDSDSFSLNQASIFLSRQKEDEDIGFSLVTDFGKEAELVGNVTHWSNNPTSSESTNSIELREAYLTYKLPGELPWGGRIKLKGGKFVTLLGYEVIKNWNAFNPNVSQSMIFGYAIPFTHTGITAQAPLGDMFGLELGVVNGWDNPSDNNQGKTLLGGVSITPPIDWLSFYVSGTYGPEQNHSHHSNRGVTTLVTTIKALENLTFVVEGVYGNESNLIACSATSPSAKCSAMWWGGSAYVIYDATDYLTLALRTEALNDADGTRTLVKQTGWEITPTVAVKLTEGLTWRTEYRHDESNQKYFERDNNVKNNLPGVRGQDTIATELIYAF